MISVNDGLGWDIVMKYRVQKSPVEVSLCEVIFIFYDDGAYPEYDGTNVVHVEMQDVLQLEIFLEFSRSDENCDLIYSHAKVFREIYVFPFRRSSRS
ncbi:unnamed protein product [Toxocara canis]|uniref:MATH domain-containing protein n=1 Tax=Toxocara canis TaxID=6265 RepID=A0A183UNB3_TOXCA|nr:unnamed protein product [Toxocara canis]